MHPWAGMSRCGRVRGDGRSGRRSLVSYPGRRQRTSRTHGGGCGHHAPGRGAPAGRPACEAVPLQGRAASRHRLPVLQVRPYFTPLSPLGPSADKGASSVAPLSLIHWRCRRLRAPKAPMEEPILYLNGTDGGIVNNCCFPSTVAPSYAPAGQVGLSPLPIHLAFPCHW